MMIRGFSIAVLAFSLAVVSGVAAQTYPAKPIRMVVGFVAGGSTDALARLYAQRLGASLAVTSASRSPLAPEIPTVVESGLPGYVATTWYGVLAPAGTPRSIVERLNWETSALLGDAATKGSLTAQGVVSAPMTPEEFGSFLRAEVGKWAKIALETGAKAG